MSNISFEDGETLGYILYIIILYNIIPFPGYYPPIKRLR